MIVVDSKKKKLSTLMKNYGEDCIVIDVTSHAEDEFQKFSPFYPHGGIPVPNSNGYTADCVEGIWQGLKTFETTGVDTAQFHNRTMKNIKRTVRRFGRCLGHRYGMDSTELLGYIDARHKLYLPAYKWVLENKCQDELKKIRIIAKHRTVVLLDYETNSNVDDPSKPLSHASLVKAYIDGNFPEA